MKVTRSGFARLARAVAEDADATSAKGKLVGFLEGGYHLGGLAESVEATLQVWTGKESSAVPDRTRPDDLVKRQIAELSDRYELN